MENTLYDTSNPTCGKKLSNSIDKEVSLEAFKNNVRKMD